MTPHTDEEVSLPQKRKYTGVTDGIAKGPRAGTEEFVKQAISYSGKQVWNNGTFGVRMVKGNPKALSVHATGRAMDLSWRGKSKIDAKHFIEVLADNGFDLGTELILDYNPKPFGRGWKCTRGTWESYSKAILHGSPNGDWYHIELCPEFADDPAKVRAAFKAIFK